MKKLYGIGFIFLILLLSASRCGPVDESDPSGPLGSSEPGPKPIVGHEIPPNLGKVTKLEIGRFDTCVINMSQELICWGRSFYGNEALKDGIVNYSNLFNKKFKDMSTVTEYVFALDQNDKAQLIGFNKNKIFYEEADVASLTTLGSSSTDDSLAACVIKKDNSFKCFGSKKENGLDQAGAHIAAEAATKGATPKETHRGMNDTSGFSIIWSNGKWEDYTHNTATKKWEVGKYSTGNAVVTAVSIHPPFNGCVIFDTKKVSCEYLSKTIPDNLKNEDYIGVAVGSLITFAIKTNNTVVHWLGDPKYKYHGLEEIPAGLKAKAVKVGFSHACAITTADGLICWGGKSEK